MSNVLELLASLALIMFGVWLFDTRYKGGER